jgi:hypothetical protein
MSKWHCKAYRHEEQWSVSIIDSFGTIYNIPGGADQIEFIFTPKDHHTTVFTWSEENGQGLQTATNYQPGMTYTRARISGFRSWAVFVNTMHA